MAGYSVWALQKKMNKVASYAFFKNRGIEGFMSVRLNNNEGPASTSLQYVTDNGKSVRSAVWDVLTKDTKFFDLGSKVAKLVVDGFGYQEPFFVNFISKADVINGLCGLKKKVVDLFSGVEKRRSFDDRYLVFAEGFRFVKDHAAMLSTIFGLTATLWSLKYGDESSSAKKFRWMGEALAFSGAVYSLGMACSNTYLNMTGSEDFKYGAYEKGHDEVEEASRRGFRSDLLSLCKEGFGVYASMIGLGFVKRAPLDLKVIKTVSSFLSGAFGFTKDVYDTVFPLKSMKYTVKNGVMIEPVSVPKNILDARDFKLN